MSIPTPISDDAAGVATAFERIRTALRLAGQEGRALKELDLSHPALAEVAGDMQRLQENFETLKRVTRGGTAAALRGTGADDWLSWYAGLDQTFPDGNERLRHTDAVGRYLLQGSRFAPPSDNGTPEGDLSYTMPLNSVPTTAVSGPAPEEVAEGSSPSDALFRALHDNGGDLGLPLANALPEPPFPASDSPTNGTHAGRIQDPMRPGADFTPPPSLEPDSAAVLQALRKETALEQKPAPFSVPFAGTAKDGFFAGAPTPTLSGGDAAETPSAPYRHWNARSLTASPAMRQEPGPEHDWDGATDVVPAADNQRDVPHQTLLRHTGTEMPGTAAAMAMGERGAGPRRKTVGTPAQSGMETTGGARANGILETLSKGLFGLNEQASPLVGTWDEWLRSASGSAQPPVEGKFGYDAVKALFTRSMEAVESSNGTDMAATTSSARGWHQFLDGTWKSVARKYAPERVRGMNDEELLKLRFNRDFSRDMVSLYVDRELAPALERAGLPVTPLSLYATWHFGPGGGPKVMGAADTEMMAKILSKEAIDANDYLKDMSVGEWKNKYARKFYPPLPGHKPPVPPEPPLFVPPPPARKPGVSTSEAPFLTPSEGGQTSSIPSIDRPAVGMPLPEGGQSAPAPQNTSVSFQIAPLRVVHEARDGTVRGVEHLPVAPVGPARPWGVS
ncbi:hypothetical protein [Azospirillum sp. TSO22-1]|uniref:hypothetical protein n=1 Tax=Azospirillum sp. TSO22-1 TaxID=716789 RepID=UPI000D60AED3|nr:hypothetical protein [Azospirillum sp. TSO22-1]PWC44273.1 hypothetical protein TSO221_18445 [Azospirillum sp. TSO22-1]